MESTEVCVDAFPPTESNHVPSTESTCCPSQVLDFIMTKLNVDDYRSIFFLLMDSIGPKDFLYFVKNDVDYLKEQFLDKYYEFDSKESILIELFGVMQRYDLLKIIGTCKHVYEKDKDTLNQISPFWKCLYTVCDQLTDSDVRYFKEILLPGHAKTITCAEELLCQAYVKNVFHENDLTRLKEVFKNRQDCFTILSSNSSKLSYYPIRRPTRHMHCGRAVIFNHERFICDGKDERIPRIGSDKDAVALQKMWQSFGFLSTIYKDCSYKEVLKIFYELSSEVDHSSYEAFVVCYLSHGDEGIVYASNNQPIKLVDLMDLMANKCPTLLNKPKLFFIQACTGHQVQQGVGISPSTRPGAPDVERHSVKSSINTPLYSDILMVSSFPGFVTFRGPEGSWFMKSLVETMEEYGNELTMLNIVTKVSNQVAKMSCRAKNTNLTNCKQTLICNNTLKYELKLKKLLELTNLKT